MRATDTMRERVGTLRDRMRLERITDRLGDADTERMRLRTENRALRDELARQRVERDELMHAIDRLVRAGEEAADALARGGGRRMRRLLTLGAIGVAGAAGWITATRNWGRVRTEGDRAIRLAREVRDRTRRRAEVAATEARELGREAREEVIELRDEARERARRVMDA